MAERHNLIPCPALDDAAHGWSGGTRVAMSGFDRPWGYRRSGSHISTPSSVVSPSTTYRVSFYVANPADSSLLCTNLWETSGGGFVDFTNSQAVVSGNRASYTVTAPSGATITRLRIEVKENCDSTMWLVEQTSTLGDYFDGDSANASWDGAVCNSPSTLLDTQQEARSGSSVTGTQTSVAHSQAQAEARTASSVTGTVTTVEHTTLQLEDRSVTAETGTSTATSVSVQHTAAADAETGTATGVAETVQHNATADAPTGTTTTVSFNRDSVQLPATGPLFFDFWVIDPTTGAYVAPLPDYSSAEVSPVFGEPGAVRIDYPFDGANYQLLRDGVTHEQDLEVAVWVGGRKDREMRCLLQESDADVVAEQGLHRFAGHFLEVLLAEMVVLPNPANEKQETVFNAVTAGEVVAYLVSAAQAEGYLAGVTTATFSDTTDSNGAAWGETIGNLVLSPGASYAEVLAELDSIGAAEWDITPARELRLFKWGTRGVDRTEQQPPIILRRGRHITEAARKTSVRDAGTDVLMSGKEGLYTRLSDATAVARRGRQILRYESANNIADEAALTAAAQVQLQVTTAGALELTHGLSFGPDDPLPISDYDLGDWVGSDTGNPDVAYDRLRVKQWSFAEDEHGEITGGVSLNYLFVDATERLRRRLNRLISGGAVVGTSEPPGADDGVAPAAPTGVTVDSVAYKDGIDTYASLIVGWAEVTTNSDGTAATDVAGYRVEWRHDTDPVDSWNLGADVSGTSASFGGVGSGVDVRVRVAAYDRNGNVSAWSAEVVILTETDLTAPPVPSTPVVAPYLGQLKIAWDGLGSAGEAMPPDLDYVEVHLSTAAGFTPDATTLIDQFSTIAGVRVATDLPYGVEHFVRLVAVDRTRPVPNRSAPSATGSATPSQVVAADVFDGAIGSAKLADLAVITAKIDDLAVNNAKIADVEVGKLTAGVMTAEVTNSGIIRSDTSGQRYELDAASLRLYDPAGTQTVGLTGATGTNFITGELRTALSGERLVLNPNGSAPNEMRFYPTSGSMFATIRPFTATAPNSGQAGMVLRAYAARADGATGEVSVLPSGASLTFGEVGDGPILTRVEVTEQQASALAPRVHLISGFQDGVSDDGKIRFGIGDGNTPVSYIARSMIHHQDTNGDGTGNGLLWCLNRGSAIQFDTNTISCVVNDSGGLADLNCLTVNEGSSRSVKTNIRPLPFDPVQAVLAAEAMEFEYTQDYELPERPPGLDRNGKPFPPYDRSRGVPKRIGPMAEDLPPQLLKYSPDDGTVKVSLNSKVGLLWAAVAQLATRLAAIDQPGGPNIPGGPPQ